MVQPVQTVRPLEALADDLGGLASPLPGLRIGEVPLKTQADTGGGDLAGTLGISKEQAAMLKLGAEAISVMLVAGNVVSANISAMQWLGIFGEEPNPYDEMYERIGQRLRGMLQSTFAGQTLQTIKHSTC
jgi:hypothetical protein